MPVSLIVIAHNIRSSHNIGALMRTAEGLGVQKLFLTGYSPYPETAYDSRLPHIMARATKQIQKTALGAEKNLAWEHCPAIGPVIGELASTGYTIAGLEQIPGSIPLESFVPPQKLAIVLGCEVSGIDPEIRGMMEYFLEIPMRGSKDSYNVVEAATMAMYQCLARTRQ